MGSYHVYQQYNVQNTLLYSPEDIAGKASIKDVILRSILKDEDLTSNLIINDLIASSQATATLNKINSFIEDDADTDYPKVSPGIFVLNEFKRELLQQIVQDIEGQAVNIAGMQTREPTQAEWDQWNEQESITVTPKPHSLYHIVSYKVPDTRWLKYPNKIYLYKVYSNLHSVFPTISLAPSDITVDYVEDTNLTKIRSTNLAGVLVEGLEITFDFGEATAISDFKFTLDNVGSACSYTILYSNVLLPGMLGYAEESTGVVSSTGLAVTSNFEAAYGDVVRARYWKIQISSLDDITSIPTITNLVVNSATISHIEHDFISDIDRGAYTKVPPPIFLRKDNVNFYDEDGATPESITKYFDNIDLDATVLIDDIMSSPDVIGNEHFIDNVYVNYGIPILASDSISAEYLYNYFLHLNAAGKTSQEVSSTNYEFSFNCAEVNHAFHLLSDIDSDPTSDEYQAYYSISSKFDRDNRLKKEYYTTSTINYVSQYILKNKIDLNAFMAEDYTNIINPLYIGPASTGGVTTTGTLSSGGRLVVTVPGSTEMTIQLDGSLSGNIEIYQGSLTEVPTLSHDPNVTPVSPVWSYSLNNEWGPNDLYKAVTLSGDTFTIVLIGSGAIEATAESDLGYGMVTLTRDLDDYRKSVLYKRGVDDNADSLIRVSRIPLDMLLSKSVSYYHITKEGLSEYQVRTPTATYKVVDSGSGNWRNVSFSLEANNLEELVIPLSIGLAKSYGLQYNTGQLLRLSTHLSVYVADYYRVKKKWYERGIVGVIITLVVLYFSNGTVNLSALFAAMVKSFLISVLISTIVQIIAPNSKIAALIAAIAVAYFAYGYGTVDFSTFGFNDFVKLFGELANVISQVITVSVQNSMAALTAKQENLLSEYEEALDGLKEIYEDMFKEADGATMSLLDSSTRVQTNSMMDPERFYDFHDGFNTIFTMDFEYSRKIEGVFNNAYNV